MYRPPYEEYITDGSSFAAQLYEIVVVRKCRPTLIRELNDKQHTLVDVSLFFFFFLSFEHNLLILSRLFMNYVY